MKKTLSLLLLLALCLGAQAQIPQKEALLQDFHERLYRVGMNMDPYEYLPGPQTPAPKGYKPFYISHYGRHGSRSNWAGDLYAQIQAKYQRAADAGLLTEEGLRTKETIDRLIALHDNMDGRLTPLGAEEHRQIAGRMYANYARVFKKGSKKVTARSSVVPRVLVSMTAFTGELLSRQGDLDISWDTGEEIMKLVSTDSPRPVTKAVWDIIHRHQDKHTPDTLDFQRRVFLRTDPSVTGSTKTFMSQTFDMAVGCAAFELGDRIFRLFTDEDLLAYNQIHVLSFYLRQCNSVEYGDDRMPSVNPTIEDIIERADAAIATGETAADLRFGHDYHVLALGSRLGLKGIAERMTAEECLYWPGWRYTPFAANIQLIFYKNKQGDVLVKPLLNERETPVLGLEGGPYYSWEDREYVLAQKNPALQRWRQGFYVNLKLKLVGRFVLLHGSNRGFFTISDGSLELELKGNSGFEFGIIGQNLIAGGDSFLVVFGGLISNAGEGISQSTVPLQLKCSINAGSITGVGAHVVTASVCAGVGLGAGCGQKGHGCDCDSSENSFDLHN